MYVFSYDSSMYECSQLRECISTRRFMCETLKHHVYLCKYAYMRKLTNTHTHTKSKRVCEKTLWVSMNACERWQCGSEIEERATELQLNCRTKMKAYCWWRSVCYSERLLKCATEWKVCHPLQFNIQIALFFSLFRLAWHVTCLRWRVAPLC